MLLTNSEIKNLSPGLKPKKYTDGEGLYLLVKPNGTKCWRFKYNYFDKEKLLSIGTYPAVSLLEARAKKIEAKRLLREGKDPCNERKQNELLARLQLANTFEATAKEWHEVNIDKWTPKHATTILYRLNAYVFPFIGNRPISEIVVIEVLEILRRIEKTGKIELCHRVLQYCTSIFRFAVLTQRTKQNPCIDLKGVLKTRKPIHRPTIKIDELPEFIKRLELSETLSVYKQAIRLLLLTFVRPGELRKAKWEYFDFNKKLWVIPAELMKMRKEHIVPLSVQAVQLLKEIKQISDNKEYVFPTRNNIRHPYMNEKRYQ